MRCDTARAAARLGRSLLAVIAVCAAAPLATAAPPAKPTSAPVASPEPELRQRVDAIVSAVPGRISFFAQNLRTGASLGRNEDEPVRSASTIKLAVMVEAFARVAAGEARWDEPVILTEAAKVQGAGILPELHDGLSLTFRDAVRLMIVLSDNTAANLVIDRLGADTVNARMDGLGLARTRLLRKIGGGGDSAAGRDPANKPYGIGVTTPREMVALLAKLERGEVVSREASAEMLEVLKREQYGDGIGRTLPGVTCATKSGALDRLRSDVGIVWSEGGPVAMAITVDDLREIDWTEDNPGLLAIARLSRALAEGLAAPLSAPLTGTPREKVLALLRRVSGRATIAGQHNREPSAQPTQWTDAIFRSTGRYPGLWSGDFLFQAENVAARPAMIAEAKRQWQRGALVNLMWHACPPEQGEPCEWEGGVLSHVSDARWDELVTDGTPLNARWKARLDGIAAYLLELQGSGVAVLWRPLHEMNQGKFWWGGRPGPRGTARLYRITRDYLEREKGLRNLVWVWDVQDLDWSWAGYDPGAAYWDVLAMDMYDASGYTPRKYETILSLAGDKPVAIGECERLPTAAELTAQPGWTFFMPWAELVYKGQDEAAVRALYAEPRVLTRDELPGWN